MSTILGTPNIKLDRSPIRLFEGNRKHMRAGSPCVAENISQMLAC